MEIDNNPVPVTTPPVQPLASMLPSSQIPQKPKMKRWKKVLLWFFGILIFLALAVYSLPWILTLIFPGDAKLLDDSQVRLQKISVPDSENGFFDLFKISNCTSNDLTDCNSLIALPDGFDDLAYTNYIKPVVWDQKLVDEALEKNQQTLLLVDQAASKQYLQIPDYADPTNLHISYKLYPLNAWRTAARLQAIKSLSLSYQGKPDEALQEAVKLNKLGHNMLAGNNNLIGSLVGIAIRRLGSETILQILPYGSSSKETLVQVNSVLGNSSNNLEGYKNMLRFEYTHISNSLDETFSLPREENLKQSINPDDPSPSYSYFMKYGYYYKKNQTKNLYLNLHKQEVEAIGVRCELKDLDEQLELFQHNIVSWKLPFTENAVGKIIFSVTGLPLGAAITKGCEADLLSNIVQIQFAIKQYQMDNGSLPTSLDALVPNYLESVSQDPFDHQPIRYNAEKKILYSVGLNKKDLGGSTGDDWAKMENPTFKIGF